MERVIELRSDTMSLPSPEMLATAMTATLGDDVYGEDPTVNALQEKVANLLGKEAALFVPTGTMGNLICVLNHCWGRGYEVILGDKNHIHLYEQGSIAQFGGVHSVTAKTLPDGTFSIEEMESLVRSENVHFPITKLVCIENTHNICGGTPLPLKWIDEVGEKCRELGLPLHIDGTRIFNAAVYHDVPVKRLVKDASSVNICLSKGLGAPAGNVIAGSKDFIMRAVRLRKALGGGMRQSGVLAAMGIYAIDHAVESIQKDHKLLRLLIEGIKSLGEDFVQISGDGPFTNFLYLVVTEPSVTADQLCERLNTCTEEEFTELKMKITCKTLAVSNQVRMVTNSNFKENDVQLLIKKLRYIRKEIQGNKSQDNADA